MKKRKQPSGNKDNPLTKRQKECQPSSSQVQETSSLGVKRKDLLEKNSGQIKRQKDHQVLHNKNQKQVQDLYIDQNAFNQKNNNGYYYQATDINTLQKQIMQPYWERFNIHEPIGDIGSAAPVLRELIRSLEEAKPTFCIYNLGNWHWVVFASLKINEQITVLYKDSKGSYNSLLESQVKEISDTAKFIIHPGKEQTSGVDCGPFALQNMRIMAREITHNKDSFVENFKSFSEFCTLRVARHLRVKEFADQYVLGTYQGMMDEAIKAEKLQKLREHHSSEAREIAKNLKEAEFFKAFNIKALSGKESVITKAKNLIAIEVNTTECTDPDSNNYSYVYRISFSKDIAHKAGDIISNLQTLFPGIYPEINVEGGVIRILAGGVSTITKKSKLPVTDYLPPVIKFDELLENLNTKQNWQLHEDVRQILKHRLEQQQKIDYLPKLVKEYLGIAPSSLALTLTASPTETLKRFDKSKKYEDSDSEIGTRSGIKVKINEPGNRIAKKKDSKQEAQEVLGLIKDLIPAEVATSVKSNHTNIISQYSDILPLKKLLSEQRLEARKEKSKDVFLKLASKTSAQEQIELAKEFNDLASLNIGAGNETHNLAYYTTAAVHYQYVISIIDKQLSSKSIAVTYKKEAETLKNISLTKLKEIHELIIREIGAVVTDIEATSELDKLPEELSRKSQLTELRDDICKKINQDATDTRELFDYIATEMKSYLKSLFEDAEKIFGKPPCKYSVIGLGSMALKQLTPYSDLEFAILTIDENYKQSSKPLIRNYFKDLSHYVHFKVICLGETIIPTSEYNFDLSFLVKQAVNFDLGGKTPLGRRDKYYDLIQTVDGMLKYIKNKDNKSEHIDKVLPYILEANCYVYGDKEIVRSYQTRVKEFLLASSEDGRSNDELRAIKMLQKGVIEIDYIGNKPPTLLRGNLEKFNFDAYTFHGKIFDVKQEIYRLPDRLIYGLGSIYGVQATESLIDGISAWDIVDGLTRKKIINPEAASNLKRCIDFAVNLRLKAYQHYGYQKENMDFRVKNCKEEVQQRDKRSAGFFCLNKEDLLEDGALFKYYYTALPLRNKIQIFCDQNISTKAKQQFFIDELFYQNDEASKASICLRLMRYKEHLKYEIEYLERLKSQFDVTHPNVANSLSNIGRAYGYLGDHQKALKCHKQAFALLNKLFDGMHPNVATSLSNIGMTYGYLGDHRKALKCHERALALYKNSFGDKHPLVATSLDNLGVTYGDLGKHQEALQCQKEGFVLLNKLFGGIHPHVATSLDNLGVTYCNLGRHHKALQHQVQALRIRIKLFSDTHVSIAISLNNIGVTYGYLGDNQKALEYQKQGFVLLNKLFGGIHPHLVTILESLGTTYSGLDNHQKALKCFERMLLLETKLFGDTHPHVVTSLDNLGVIYSDLGNHQKALKCFERALVLGTKLSDDAHSHVMAILESLGTTYSGLGNHQKALECFERALALGMKLFDGSDLHVAGSLNKVGMAYYALGMHDKCIEYLKQAYIMTCKILGQNHPNSKGLKNFLLVEASDFLKNNESREIIKQRWDLDNLTIKVKCEIQQAVLNKIINFTFQSSYVPREVFGYIIDTCLKSKLGLLAKETEAIEIAKMLCFEAICLGVMKSSKKEKNLTCAIDFVTRYPELITKIALVHPEYFVDASIVRACVKEPMLITILLDEELKVKIQVDVGESVTSSANISNNGASIFSFSSTETERYLLPTEGSGFYSSSPSSTSSFSISPSSSSYSSTIRGLTSLMGTSSDLDLDTA